MYAGIWHTIQLAEDNIKKYIDERPPEEYEKYLVGLNGTTKRNMDTAHGTGDKREKIRELSLAKECYPTKLDLLTNGTVADAVIRFVAHRFKDKIKSPSGSSHIF